MSDEKKIPGAPGSLSRREFLARTTLSVATAGSVLPRLSTAAAAEMPRRALGGTGLSVSILAFGCGSRFLMYEDATVAHGVLEDALALGLNYFDTAVDYGAGQSETRVGHFLKARRSEVHVATKVPAQARTRDGALREVEGSLKRLQTDHVDVLHLHSLGDAADLARCRPFTS